MESNQFNSRDSLQDQVWILGFEAWFAKLEFDPAYSLLAGIYSHLLMLYDLSAQDFDGWFSQWLDG